MLRHVRGLEGGFPSNPEAAAPRGVSPGPGVTLGELTRERARVRYGGRSAKTIRGGFSMTGPSPGLKSSAAGFGIGWLNGKATATPVDNVLSMEGWGSGTAEGVVAGVRTVDARARNQGPSTGGPWRGKRGGETSGVVVCRFSPYLPPASRFSHGLPRRGPDQLLLGTGRQTQGRNCPLSTRWPSGRAGLNWPHRGGRWGARP